MSDDYKKWRGDFYYDAWRRGVSESRMDEDRMHEAYRSGCEADSYAARLQHDERIAAQEREDARQAEAEYWDQIDQQSRQSQ